MAGVCGRLAGKTSNALKTPDERKFRPIVLQVNHNIESHRPDGAPFRTWTRSVCD
jgi:hypothetical protein